MKRLALLVLAAATSAPVASAQITTISPFTSHYVEEFETLLTYPWPQCLPGRAFQNSGDICTPLGPYCVDTFGWLLYCSIYAHNGSNGLFGSAQGPVECTFDVPAQRFGGYFGTNGYVPGGVAHFYDDTGALIGNMPITAPACAWAWNGWDAGSGAKIKRVVLYANDPNNQGGLLQMDDLVQTPTTGPISVFCVGDGSGTACPCGNDSQPGNDEGCLSSLGQGGILTGAGTPSIASDTLVLDAQQMPNSSALYFQGTTRVNGGAGSVFGDGLRCAGGTTTRLATKINSGGQSQYPSSGDPQISVRGSCTAGTTRTYQVWYRNAATYCTASAFNLTNAVEVSWGA